MTPFTVTDSNGVVLRAGYCDDASLAAQAGAGETVHAVACPDWRKKRVRIVDNVPVVEDDTDVGSVSIGIRRARMLARLAMRREKIEFSHIKLGPMTVDASLATRVFFAAAARRAEADPEFSTTFRVAINGTVGWAVLMDAQVRTIEEYLFARSVRCNEREAALTAQINASSNPESLLATINQFFEDETVAIAVDPPPQWVL